MDEEFSKWLAARDLQEFKQVPPATFCGYFNNNYTQVMDFRLGIKSNILGNVISSRLNETLSPLGNQIYVTDIIVLAVNGKYYQGRYQLSTDRHCYLKLMNSSSFGNNVIIMERRHK